MIINHFEIEGPVHLQPSRYGDARGFFCETYNKQRFYLATGLDITFVQDNLAYSLSAGTIRGLHFQRPPTAQAKLVSVLRGAILDVALDIRIGSPSYGRHLAVRLSADAGDQIFIPEGFAHGYCTLDAETLVTYKVTDYYSAADEGGLFWADPALAIAWPVAEAEAIVSEKDRLQPRLAGFESPWTTF